MNDCKNMSKFLMLAIIVIAIVLHQRTVNSLTCRNEAGEPVDWFIVYKIPLLQKETSKLLTTGYSYAFISGPRLESSGVSLMHSLFRSKERREQQDSWELSDRLIANSSSILGQTLAPLFSESGKQSVIMYNDQPPVASRKSSSASLAHAKGVLAIDGQTGFWLIHSVPHFPESSLVPGSKYSYPASGKENGQTAICVSFRTKAELDHIVSQLLCMRPNVYAMSVSADVSKISSNLQDLKAGRWPKGVKESIQQVVSINGRKFTSFARNSKSQHKDLYLELIAPELTSDLLVESWRRGAGSPLTSNCTYKYKVNNVEAVELRFGSAGRATSPWSYMEDHSKWAVAVQKPVTCIGDINRMASQYKRGGGSLCFPDPDVWSIVRNSVHAVEGCPRPNVRTVGDTGIPKSTSRGNKSSPPHYSQFHVLLSLTLCHLLVRLRANNDEL